MNLYAVFHAVHFIMCHCETKVPNVLKKAGHGCFSQSHLGSNPSTLRAWHRGKAPNSSKNVLLQSEPSGTGGTKASPSWEVCSQELLLLLCSGFCEHKGCSCFIERWNDIRTIMYLLRFNSYLTLNELVWLHPNGTKNCLGTTLSCPLGGHTPS